MRLSKGSLERGILYCAIIAIILFFVTNVIALKYLAAMAGILLFVIESCRISTKYWIIYLIGCLVFLGLLMEILVTQSLIGINAFPMLVAHIGMALVLLRRKVNPTIMGFIFFLCVVYFSYLMLTGVSPSDALVGASRNHVSTLMIFICSLLYLSYVRAGKAISMIPAGITFLVSLWAIGRSGIIASLVLLVGVFLFSKRSMIHYVILGLAIIGALTFVEIGVPVGLPFVTKPFSFERDIISNARWTINISYLRTLDLTTLLTGFDWPKLYSFCPMVHNLHNSFANAHFRLGIFALAIFAITITALYKAFIRKDLYFVLLLTILLRAFTDTIMLPAGLFDFIFYYLLAAVICGDGNSRTAVAIPRPRPSFLQSCGQRAERRDGAMSSDGKIAVL